MGEKMAMRKAWFGITLVTHLIFGVLAGLGWASSANQRLEVFSTQQADIFYEHRADLYELARRLGVSRPGAPGPPDLPGLAAKIDGMLEEISRVLQKWPIKPVKLNIRLLRDGFQVQHQQLALRRIPPNRALLGQGLLESFYDPCARTIFLSLMDARLGILAHEMTHFILCESYPVWPSATFQESLAQYMEGRFRR